MKLFLDSYYLYSWVRLYTSGVKRKIEKEKGKRNIEQNLVFEDLQLPVFSPRKFNEKINTILQHRVIRDLRTQFVINRSSKKINLLKLLEKNVSDEHIPIIEYLLLADDSGRVDEKIISREAEIKINETIRRRIIDLNKLQYPYLSPFNYRKYLIARISRILKVQVIEEHSSSDLIMGVADIISQVETNLCKSDEAKKYCDVVRKLGSVRKHPDDVRLVAAVATYASRNEPLLIVPKIPIGYECFYHVLNYIRQEKSLMNRLVILEG